MIAVPTPALSSRAQLVSGRFYSCRLLLFPGIYQAGAGEASISVSKLIRDISTPRWI